MAGSSSTQSHIAPDNDVAFSASYDVLGVPVQVLANDPEAFVRVSETYAAFERPHTPPPVFRAWLMSGAEGVEVGDTRGYARRWPDVAAATIDLLDRMVHGVLAAFHARGIYAIHAGACVHLGAAMLIAGRSGQGKTTLVLGLLRKGFGLLSDEFAVAEPGTQRLLPYQRSIHIRPGTPELIPELAWVAERPQVRLGGGIEWTLTSSDLERSFPGCLAEPAPLRHVLLLEGAPQPTAKPSIEPVAGAVAAMALVRGTWAASQDFAAGLARIASLLDGVRCARLRVGALDATTEHIASWLEAQP